MPRHARGRLRLIINAISRFLHAARFLTDANEDEFDKTEWVTCGKKRADMYVRNLEALPGSKFGLLVSILNRLCIKSQTFVGHLVVTGAGDDSG